MKKLFPLALALALSLPFAACKKEKDDPTPTTPTAAAPIVTSLSPTSGLAGSAVTITGTNLTGTAVVSFNGTAAPAFTVNSATAVTVTVPAGATTGSLTLTTPGGTSNGLTFTVLPTAPTITRLRPAAGPAGATITVVGARLTGATAVSFNGTTATRLTVLSDTTLTVVVPMGATTGPLIVTTPSGPSNGVVFTVQDRADLLVGGNWRLTALSSSPGFDNGTGTPITDLYSLQPDCVRDNLLRFTLPNVYTTDEGPTKCASADPQTQTGTWALDATQEHLTFTQPSGTQTGLVTILSATTFQFASTENIGSTVYTITATYTRQ